MSNMWDTWGEQSGPRPRRVALDFKKMMRALKPTSGPTSSGPKPNQSPLKVGPPSIVLLRKELIDILVAQDFYPAGEWQLWKLSQWVKPLYKIHINSHLDCNWKVESTSRGRVNRCNANLMTNNAKLNFYTITIDIQRVKPNSRWMALKLLLKIPLN